MASLRIFLSSTMTDELENERAAVVQRLRLFNFEPVNAEGWLPDGGGIWATIERQIRESDLFVLILGERYGWIPKAGPKADEKVSVTHLEFRAARDLGLPILVFTKELGAKANRRTREAKDRARFWQEVRDWDQGDRLTTSFRLANDLAEKVGQTVAGLLTDFYQRARMQERMAARLPEAATAPGSADVLSYSPGHPRLPSGAIRESGPRGGAFELPPALVEKVAAREAVLLAGAGISLAAGLPSAAALAAGMVQAVRRQDPGYGWSPAGSAFFETATDLEALQGRNRLTEVIRDFVDPPQGAVPTPAHRYALRLFDQILTTNYDELFEEAARQEKLRPAVVVGEPRGTALPTPALIKMQGTVSQPDSLVITERDVLLYDRTHPNLWSAALELLRSRMVIVVGSSLRDPSIVRLLAEAGPRMSGFFVTLSLSAATRARLRSWNLEGIEADANSFFQALTEAV